MIKRILYLVEDVLSMILVLASGLGLFVTISFIVHEFAGPEWLTTNAMLVFLLGGVLLSIGIAKLLEIVQFQLLHIQAAEIEAEWSKDEKAAELFEHLRVR